MMPAQRPTPRLSLRQLMLICLGAITIVFVVSTAFSVFGRVNVARATDRLGQRMLPAQEHVAALSKAYVDQETGQRGFMLTADPSFLEPYVAGKADVDRLVAQLHDGLVGDGEASRRLDAVVAAANDWVAAADLQIDARRRGPIAPDQLEAMTLWGKRLFDQLRARLSALDARTGELITRELVRVHAAQRLANIAQVTAVVLLLAVVAGAVWLLDHLLTRPVNRVLNDVTAVADGRYDRAIRSAGLREVALLADAAETMRDNLRTSTTRLLDSERRDEQARMAADLNDRTIQRVFALGLGLTSAAQRRSPDLKPFVDETDRIIADLRQIVFNLAVSGPAEDRADLHGEVIDVVDGSAPALGFTPSLEFDGRIDARTCPPAARTGLVEVLRESLSSIASHAQASAVTIRVAATDGRVCLTLRDNGIGAAAIDPGGELLANISRRAEQLGGQATMRDAGDNGGTLIEWVIPLTSKAEEPRGPR
ncbi:MAG: hypothetical protein QOC58_257 [Mycobacterium sp.]|nr:hypothetical protein [Mycobacterium sp.]